MPHRNNRVRLLIVEDDPAQAKLTQVVLAQNGFPNTTVAATAAAALEHAPASDLVLLDIQLPDGNGLDVLRQLRERSSRPAVVIVTAHGAEQVAVEALRLGADDYISKDAGFTELLPRVVERVRRTLALRDTLEAAEQEIVVAERRAAVGEMTVALHHELNNPLMAALTEVALLREERGLSPAVARGLAAIGDALERIRLAVKRAGEADASRSVDYLTDLVRMTDLDARGALIATRGRAVVIAQDPGMTRVIGVLLRRAGFELESFDSAADANARLDLPPSPTVVIAAGDATLQEECRRDHDWPLVVLAPPGASGVLGQYADLIIPVPFDPGTFAGQVLEAVERRSSGR